MTDGSEGFQRFIRPLVLHKLLTKNEEYELINQARKMKPGAMSALVRANIRMLLSFAQKNRIKAQKRGLFLEDLFNIAAIGMQRGVLKFDTLKNVRFSTYAAWWIRQEMTRTLDNTGETIRVPVHHLERGREIERVIARYRTEFGRDPETAYICKQTGFSTLQVREEMTSPKEPISLDMPARRSTFGGTDQLYVDTIPGPDKNSPDVQLEIAQQKDQLETIKKKLLLPVERKVLQCRFTEDMTLKETAVVLTKSVGKLLTGEGVRQIEMRALKKLREAMDATTPSHANSSS